VQKDKVPTFTHAVGTLFKNDCRAWNSTRINENCRWNYEKWCMAFSLQVS